LPSGKNLVLSIFSRSTVRNAAIYLFMISILFLRTAACDSLASSRGGKASA
jgi:hypothetical protein